MANPASHFLKSCILKLQSLLYKDMKSLHSGRNFVPHICSSAT